MINTGTGAHGLYIAIFYNGYVVHAVLMLQVALQRDRNDLHIIVRVFAEAHARINGIIV